MKTKKPMLKESVGALYLAFNNPNEDEEFDLTSYDETIKSEVVKSINTTENTESAAVRASGQVYETVSQNASIDQAVEVVAFDPEDIAKMRADKIGKYIVKSGSSSKRPFFGFGKVKKLLGGGVEYVWYPKCQLVENTDDIATSEENFSEQNDTLTIRAYSFDKEGNKSVRINSEMINFPKGITEEKFFTKPITSDEEIEALITEGA